LSPIVAIALCLAEASTKFENLAALTSMQEFRSRFQNPDIRSD